MKRTREEYDNAIAILEDGAFLKSDAPALEAMRELRDSAFALEEALVIIGELRPAVLAFALIMEEVLKANDHKGHWKDCLSAYLYSRLQEEVVELLEAWKANNPEMILKEAVDVANFAMMIADNTGHLQRVALTRWAAAPPATAAPSPSSQSEKIMGTSADKPSVPPTLGFK